MKQNATFHPKPIIIVTSMAESCSFISPNKHCADGKLKDIVAYLKLKDCRNHYFQNPDSFHINGRIYEHCDYHWTKSYFHRNYKLLIRQLAIDMMLYGRAFLVQRNQEEDYIRVEAKFSGYLEKQILSHKTINNAKTQNVARSVEI